MTRWIEVKIMGSVSREFNSDSSSLIIAAALSGVEVYVHGSKLAIDPKIDCNSSFDRYRSRDIENKEVWIDALSLLVDIGTPKRCATGCQRQEG